ncbi:hypothetical protein [Streptomyces sp. NBC_00687]|uniref:hypothetical protein n=1 Tax=Streptomyces sp. NBC_00687 TaxID=2975807 RepID=UPI002253868D|nr:hypothetical protein [Streptomyces sp. NBC_00687]MCX4920246.1 hypothetical protein [Streptomyces sp. NBC_00687]
MTQLSTLAALTPSLIFVLFLLALLMVCAVCATVLLLARRLPPEELATAFLGISYIFSALAGWLPWGKTSAQPSLPQPPSPPAEPEAPQTVLVVGSDRLLRSGEQGGVR